MPKVIERFIDGIIAASLMAIIVVCIVAYVGIGSGLIDPYRLFSAEPKARVLTVK